MSHSQTDIIEQTSGYWLVRGDALHEQAKMLAQKGSEIIENASSEVIMDLSELGAVNTVTIAVLLQWIRSAKRYDVALKIQALPDQLIRVIAFSDLEGVFKVYLGDEL